MTVLSADVVSDLPLAEIPFPVGADRLIGVLLTRRRNRGLVVGVSEDEALLLLLQALHLALALKVERVVWCSGSMDVVNPLIRKAWNQLLEDFPGRASRFDASIAGFPDLGEAELLSGTVLVMDHAFVATGGAETELSPTVVSVRFIPESLRVQSISDHGWSFVLSPSVEQAGLVSRYLLTLPDLSAHVVDFERWQGWLATAVKVCRGSPAASIRYVAERWGGQRALSFATLGD